MWRPTQHLQMRVLLAAAAGVCTAAVITAVSSALSAFTALAAALLGAGAGLLVASACVRRALRPARLALQALHDGVVSFAENDFGTRLTESRADGLGELIVVFNRMGDVLRRERASLVQRELLLDTLLQGAPMAIVLTDQQGRVVFANHAARRLFGHPRRSAGEPLDRLVDGAPEALRPALRAGDDCLVSWDQDGHEETYRLLVRHFELHMVAHRLLVVERLTADLARQEVQVWKKAIRVMSHEVNNSLAPISSLAHSARVVIARGDAQERLPEILRTIGDRVAMMTAFLDGYARFARLPVPQPVHVDVPSFLDEIGQLFPFTRTGDLPARPGWFDPAQLQQVLIKLLKNAEESGSPREHITVKVTDTDDGLTFTVADRGHGMSDDEMRTALLPFYSSKKTGGGLGLALCAEIVEAHRGRLRLVRRDGGGTAVAVWLRHSSSSSSGSG